VPQTVQRSFTSGEIAPSVRSRADLARYANGLALCQNFIVRAQGGIYSRGGFRLVGATSDSAAVARLIPFSFNTQQTYILVVEPLKIQIIRDGGYVLSNGSRYTITTPYTQIQQLEVRFTQSADVMTLCHPDHAPANLSRTADDNWTLADIDFTPPLSAPSQPSGTVVGTGQGDFDKTYAYVVTALDEDDVESIASPVRTVTTKSLATTRGIRLQWSAVTNAVRYRVYKDPSTNSGVYGWIGNTNTSEFTDFNIAPLTDDAPPEDRDPFNGSGNKPTAVTYYQQRQVFGSTSNEPQAVFTTQTNNFVSLRTSNPVRDDDAITFTINARQVNEIRHLLPLDSLVILTSGGEWVLTEGRDEVLTPATAGVKVQSYNGCSIVPPIVINSTAIYIQEKGARVRDLGYEFANNQYTGVDLSLLSEHLFEGFEITSMAYAAEPYSIVWFVRDDGVLLGLTYQKEQQVFGWHKHTTDGLFESVAVISEEGRDAVYVTVVREINGSSVVFVERMESREVEDIDNCFYVDSGLTLDNPSSISEIVGDSNNYVIITDTAHGYDTDDLIKIKRLTDVRFAAYNNEKFLIEKIDNNKYFLRDQYTGDKSVASIGAVSIQITAESRKGVTTISGLGHLEGKALAVLADGDVIENMVVSSGSITTPYKVFILHAGLPYVPAMETLDIDTGTPQETLKAQTLSISKVTVETQDSRGLFAGPVNERGLSQDMLEFKSRQLSDAYNAIQLTSAKREIQLRPQWGRGGAIRIEQRSPLPLAILSVIPQVDIGA